MKSYHLTPEQAYRIALMLDKEGFNITTYPNGYIEAFGGREFQAFANAVLDEVLGEPVAWAEAGRENNVIANLVKQTNKNDWVRPYTVALYAPKERLNHDYSNYISKQRLGNS
jgi:hypothetical protein